MNRLGVLAAGLLTATGLLLAVVNPQTREEEKANITVSGTVDSIGVQPYVFDGPREAKLLRLEETGLVYECRTEKLPSCRTAKLGDTVTMTVDLDAPETYNDLPFIKTIRFTVQAAAACTSTSSTPS